MIKSEKAKTVILYILMIFIGLIILDIPFGLVAVIFDDSPAYLARQVIVGVVPGYPLFLSLNRAIFGETYFLQVVVVWQIIINLSASMLLIRCLRKKFALNIPESLLFYILSFVPHMVFMPEGMSTRMIVTEALAFPLFYVLVILILQAIWERKIKYGIAGLIVTVLLALVRTQMMLTFLIPIGVIFYLITTWKGNVKKYHFLARAVFSLLLSLFMFVGVFFAYKQCNKLLQYGMACLNKPLQSAYEENSNGQYTTVSEQNVLNVSDQNIEAQTRGTFCAKMLIAAEYEDKELFEDPNLREFYEELYNELYKKELLLNAVDKDLLIADRIYGQLDNVYKESHRIAQQYNQEPGSVVQIAETLFKNHPIRWVKGMILQVPSGLISTVFFHKRAFYWFSYLVTFIIYFIAFLTVIWAIKKKVRRETIEFMVLTILINFLFVFATATAHIDQQRYVVYGFSLFYMAMYCLLKPIMLPKIFNRGEKNAA